MTDGWKEVVDRRSVLRGVGSTAALAAVPAAGGTATAEGCGERTLSFRSGGKTDSREEFRYVPRSEDPCRIRVSASTDFFWGGLVMYATTDGRRPTPGDYDAKEYSYWYTDEMTLEAVDADSVVRVLVEGSFLGVTDYDLSFEEEANGAVDCEQFHSWTEIGTLASNGSEFFSNAVVVDDPCETTVWLDGPEGADADLYVTLDGRTPSPSDFDRRSASTGADERVVLDGDEIDAGQSLGVLAKSYRDGGQFRVAKTETGRDAADSIPDDCRPVYERSVTVDLSERDALASLHSPVSPDPCAVQYVLKLDSQEEFDAKLGVRDDGRVPDGDGPAPHEYDYAQPGFDRYRWASVLFEDVDAGTNFGFHAAPEDDSVGGEMTLEVVEFGREELQRPETYSDPGGCDRLGGYHRVEFDPANVEAGDVADLYAVDADDPCKLSFALESASDGGPETVHVHRGQDASGSPALVLSSDGTPTVRSLTDVATGDEFTLRYDGGDGAGPAVLAVEEWV